LITEVLGKEIRLIDSAEVISEKVYSIIKKREWLRQTGSAGVEEDEFYVTDFPDRFKKVGEIFLKRKIEKVNAVNI
jgi:glutamate racemase